MRILRAAEDEFAAVGYDGARTVVIARRAGLTHAMLHYYFDTKAALYRAVLDRVLSDLSVRFSSAVAAAAEGGAAPPLRRLLAEAHAIFSADPRFVRMMLWEVAAGTPRLERMAAPLFDRMAAVVRRTARLGLTRSPHDPRDVAVTLLGALLIYFFEDPLVLRLFGRRRFGPAAGRRRAEHLGALADALLAPNATALRPAARRKRSR